MSHRFLAVVALVAIAAGPTGCSGCLRATVAADPPTSVLNDVGWAPDLAYNYMSDRYRQTHSQADLVRAVQALPHVRDLDIATANGVDFSDDRHGIVSGRFDTRSGASHPFTATVILEASGGYRCDSLTVGGKTVR
jgi:hypothetical protein